MKASVITLGCKVNDVESGSLIRGLDALGYEVTRVEEYADLYVINTCAVTKEAERKSRQAVGRALKFNPRARVVVCGCASQKTPEAFMEKPNVFTVKGTQGKTEILKIAEAFAEEYRGIRISDSNEYEEMPLPERLRTRNFVKIQDGCNRFCSYCVIPYLRGRSRSRSFESAKNEILSSDAMETVITGIDISDYCDGDKTLKDLLYAVKDANTRIRLGSIEESVITPELLESAKHIKNFAPQFHLSLQSGSDAVLKSMNRKYTREDFLRECKLIYSYFPNASITTDIIVGFPTETEENFSESLSIVKEAGFFQVHAFPYSPREGTQSYKKYPDLPKQVKHERLKRLLAVAREQKKAFLKKSVGQTFELVPETYDGEYTDGYSENYIKLYLPEKTEKTPIKVVAIAPFKDGLLCRKE